jgi:hypothetical protein
MIEKYLLLLLAAFMVLQYVYCGEYAHRRYYLPVGGLDWKTVVCLVDAHVYRDDRI